MGGLIAYSEVASLLSKISKITFAASRHETKGGDERLPKQKQEPIYKLVSMGGGSGERNAPRRIRRYGRCQLSCVLVRFGCFSRRL